jgi:alkaline phosphatase D
MMKKSLSVLALLCWVTCVFAQKKSELVIAFGSCNRSDLPQPLWDEIAGDKPDLWIWLGDNIYGDSNDTLVLRTKYNQQLNNEGYKMLLAQTPVIGTWDDHDFGRNDGNKTFAIKKESQQLALDFLQEPRNSPRRQQEGMYAAYDYEVGRKKIKVILLDVRYHQDPLIKGPNGYTPDPAADILGAGQWQWLEKQLKDSRADVHIIGSGLQFIPEEHATEKWGNFPASLNRFYQLLSDTRAKGVLLITGDRHIGEITKKEIPGIRYPLYEFTSSGLTHSSERDTANKNRYRVGALVTQKHYGLFRFTQTKRKLEVEATLKGEHGVVYTKEKLSIK